MDWKFFEKEDLKWIEKISHDFLKESAWGERVEISKEKVENYYAREYVIFLLQPPFYTEWPNLKTGLIS